jgi:hypothetical protein
MKEVFTLSSATPPTRLGIELAATKHFTAGDKAFHRRTKFPSLRSSIENSGGLVQKTY